MSVSDDMSDRTVLGTIQSDLDDVEVAYVAYDGVAPEMLPIRIAIDADNGGPEVDVLCAYLTLGEAERVAALLTEACAAVKAEWTTRGLD